MDNKTVNFRKIVHASLEYQAKTPMFFRRMNRWRNNSAEATHAFSRWGLLRGYFKYGFFAAYVYMFANMGCK